MTPTSHAAQAGIDLDKLEALARAADAEAHERGEWFNVYQLADGITLDASAALMGAANPAIVLDLIALARNAAHAAPAAQAVATLKKYWTGAWWTGVANDDRRRIDEAFAALAASPAPETAQADDWTTVMQRRLYDLRQDVSNACQMLSDNEWAEHFAKTPEGRVLESRITKLVGKAAHAQQDAAPKPCGWLAGSAGDGVEPMFWRREDAQRECDEHNKYERSRPDFDPENLRMPEPVYRAPSAATGKAAADNAGGQDGGAA